MAQALTGWKEHNGTLRDEGASELSLSVYLRSGHFISATFENFESKFMRQKGAPESKPVDASAMETGN